MRPTELVGAGSEGPEPRPLATPPPPPSRAAEKKLGEARREVEAPPRAASRRETPSEGAGGAAQQQHGGGPAGAGLANCRLSPPGGQAMPGAKQGYHALPAALVFFLLFFASLPMPGSQRSAAAAATFAPAGRTRDGQRQPPAGDRKILLELLLNAVGDSSSSRQRAFAPSLDRGGLVRRYGSSRSGALSSSVSREWVAGQVPPRLVAAAASRHVGKTTRRLPPSFALPSHSQFFLLLLGSRTLGWECFWPCTKCLLFELGLNARGGGLPHVCLVQSVWSVFGPCPLSHTFSNAGGGASLDPGGVLELLQVFPYQEPQGTVAASLGCDRCWPKRKERHLGLR